MNQYIKEPYLQPMDDLITALDLINHIDWDHTVIAGGSVYNSLFQVHDVTSDIDLFFYDANIQDLISLIEKIINNYYGQFNELPTIIKTDSCIKIFTERLESIDHIDLVMINYKDPKHIIDNFDISPSMFLYHKGNYYTNEQGYEFYMTRTFMINLAKISINLGHRLNKYIEKKYACLDVSNLGSNAFTHFKCKHFDIRNGDLKCKYHKYSGYSLNLSKHAPVYTLKLYLAKPEIYICISSYVHDQINESPHIAQISIIKAFTKLIYDKFNVINKLNYPTFIHDFNSEVQKKIFNTESYNLDDYRY
jgi:hypothetical protein